MKYIILLGAFQAVVVFSIFIIDHKKRSSDNILSWFLILVFVHLGSGFALHTLFPNAEIHKQFYTFITLMYSPLLWIYAKHLSGRHLQAGQKNYYHFLPAMAGAVVYFTIAGYIIVHNGNTPAAIIYYNQVVGYTAMISFPLYGALSLREARRIPSFWQSEIWLVRFIATVFILITVLMLALVLNNHLPPASRFNIDQHLWGRIFTYISLLSICLAIGRVRILFLMDTETPLPLLDYTSPETDPAVASAAETADKETAAGIPQQPRKSLLPEEQQAAIACQLKQWMYEKTVYKDPELTLDKLAAAMEISRHHLSETLNQYIGQSFYQFINEYRIREVIKLIDEHRQRKDTPNILSLAFEAGFHSKSSFNQYFKKVTGNTPSAYMKSKNMMITMPAGAVKSSLT
ncbi:Helix-turn-helix domain-containing protein [Chitinophaga ginsengisegetis]|uniref:Helix-turn-helix domain-containing protein n=1 Tax=Chitinophaga ginsengisegetis TaxID=393003 RepID=A0A1T5NKM3_9BACT|nr:helix-turn-helix domain-containing protein [Chitinophaga ginsengisegetis]SKD00906.1 Helix-turn-helix domain-containing protein [Chitinophaga ginsengisegetis]